MKAGSEDFDFAVFHFFEIGRAGKFVGRKAIFQNLADLLALIANGFTIIGNSHAAGYIQQSWCLCSGAYACKCKHGIKRDLFPYPYHIWPDHAVMHETGIP